MKSMNEVFSLYGGEVELVYNDGKHSYHVGGKKVPSVTTILGIIDKSGPLVGWAVKETVNFLRANWEPDTPYNSFQITMLLEQAKKARYAVSKEATDIGSMLHDWNELYIRSKIEGLDIVPDTPEIFEVVNAINAFLEWEAANDVVYLDAERPIFSRQHLYAGRMDVGAVVNGRRTILDFKTSKAIYPEYFLQTASYAKAREEEGEDPFEQLIILRTPKDGADFEVAIEYDIDELFDVFLTARKLYDWKMKVDGERMYTQQLFKSLKL